MINKRNLGFFLIIVSYMIYGVIFIIPFLSFSLEEKGIIIGILYTLSYIIFALGGLLLGKEFVKKLWQKINPFPWLKENLSLGDCIRMGEQNSLIESKSLLNFIGISKEELQHAPELLYFVQKFNRLEYKQGDYIIQEGEFGDSFYIIDHGNVEIIKDSEDHRRISELTDGDYFGELALFTGNPRAASAVAKGDVTVFSMTKNDFHQIIQKFPLINGTILNHLYTRLKDSYEKLEYQNEQLKEAYHIRIQLGFIFSSVVLLVSTYAFLLHLIQSDFVTQLSNGSTLIFIGSRLLDVVSLIIIIILVMKSKLSLKQFGVTLSGWQRSALESLWISIVIIGLLVYGKHLLIEYGVAGENPSIFSWHYVDWSYYTYILVAPLQEFIARGVFQGSIQRLLPGKSSWIWAILITSLIFGALHLHSSLNLGIVAVVTSLIWGWMYARHKTLVGVSLSHFLVGNTAGVLGFWEYF